MGSDKFGPMKMLAPVLLLAVSLYGQGQNSGPATTRGACSPANTGNNNTFTITCGVGKEQGDALLQIINKILANQLDPNAVMSKLDEISSGVRDIQRRTGDRALSEPQVATLLGTLGQSRQTVSVVLLGDREANAFGRQIVQVLQRAGWNVTLNYIGVASPPPYGIIVGSATLANALTQAGIEFSGGRVPMGADILIGLKPY
jgi:hypothetical protein